MERQHPVLELPIPMTINCRELLPFCPMQKALTEAYRNAEFPPLHQRIPRASETMVVRELVDVFTRPYCKRCDKRDRQKPRCHGVPAGVAPDVAASDHSG